MTTTSSLPASGKCTKCTNCKDGVVLDGVDATARPASGPVYDHLADVPTAIRAVNDRDGQRWERHPQYDDRWTAIDDDGSHLGYHGPDLGGVGEWAPFTPTGPGNKASSSEAVTAAHLSALLRGMARRAVSHRTMAHTLDASLSRALRERDEARAEVERLRADLAQTRDLHTSAHRHLIDSMTSHIRGLRSALGLPAGDTTDGPDLLRMVEQLRVQLLTPVPATEGRAA